jgi:hypothetical protein
MLAFSIPLLLSVEVVTFCTLTFENHAKTFVIGGSLFLGLKSYPDSQDYLAYP